MTKKKKIVLSVVLALACAIVACVSLERVKPGNVGVIYSVGGVEEQTLAQGWHWLSPMKHVEQFPISQQQIVFSDDPADYNKKSIPTGT